MTLKLIFLILTFVGVQNLEPLHAQNSPDLVWSKKMGDANVLKFSPDGRYVFAGIEQNILKINALNGDITDQFYGYCGTVKRIEFSPTGDTIICSGGIGGAGIALFNYNTLDTIYTTLLGSSENGANAFISPDGKRIITTTGLRGMDKPAVLIIDIATKTIIKEFIGRYNSAHQLTISSDGKYFCFNDYRGLTAYLVLIDLNTYEEKEIFGLTKLEGRKVGKGDFSPDGSKFSTSADSTFIWDLETMKIIDYINYEGFFSEGISSPKRRITGDFKYFVLSHCYQEDYSINNTIIWDMDKDIAVYEYPFPSDRALDVSKDNFVVTCGQIKWDTPAIFLLRPKWTEVSVKENNTSEAIVYPNPSDNILNIEFTSAQPENTKIEILNILGNKIDEI